MASSDTDRKALAQEGRGEPVPAASANEALFGTLLVIFLILITLGVIGAFGYFGYRLWQQDKVEERIPSIASIPHEAAPAPEPKPPTTPAPVSPAPAPSPAPTPPTIDRKQLSVRVLNGGAVKGSAGVLADKLKQAGFVKATFTSAAASYQGVTIYFAKGKEAEAADLKTEVAKTYPNATVAPAVPGGRDSTAADLVVILGQ